MKNYCVIALLLSALFAGSAFAEPVEPQYRGCEKDTDCQITSTICCGCGNGEGDAGINKKFADKHKNTCTQYQIDVCATMGACVANKISVPVCKEHQCDIERKDNPWMKSN